MCGRGQPGWAELCERQPIREAETFPRPMQVKRTKNVSLTHFHVSLATFFPALRTHVAALTH